MLRAWRTALLSDRVEILYSTSSHFILRIGVPTHASAQNAFLFSPHPPLHGTSGTYRKALCRTKRYTQYPQRNAVFATQ